MQSVKMLETGMAGNSWRLHCSYLTTRPLQIFDAVRKTV